jgi:hypothetical protein
MARRSNPFAPVHRAARRVYSFNRALRLGEAVASGSPKRVEKLLLRRLLYRAFAKLLRGL